MVVFILAGRFDSKFIEKRRRALELFLKRCTKYDVITVREVWKVFVAGSSQVRFAGG